MTLTFVIMVFGIVVGLFLGVLLLSLKNKNRIANRFLGIILIVLSIIVSGFGYTKYNLYRETPYFIEIASTMIFPLGPLFYFYFRASLQKNFSLTAKNYLHFLPFIIVTLYLLPFYLQNTVSKLAAYDSETFSMQHRIIISVQIIHAFIYVFIIRKSIKRHLHMLKKSDTTVADIYLNWIKNSVNTFALIMSITAILLALLYFGFRIHTVYSAIIPIAVSFAIISLGFFGLKQPIIFPADKETFPVKKYERSTLTEEQAHTYLDQLYTVMKEERIYLNKDITLQKLADYISVSPHHLSQVINDKMNQSFFDFINLHRVKEAKKLLAGPKGDLLTILAISEESGFNSKSSFNAAFKKFTGKTPSEYKQNVVPNNLNN